MLYDLAAHALRVLNHGVLFQRVWGPELVGESWLVREVVKRLRRNLKDDAADSGYIITEPMMGYRMAEGETEDGAQGKGGAAASLPPRS